MQAGDIVEFDLSGKRIRGELVRENERTVVVKIRLPMRAGNIKRHKTKHRVKEIDESNSRH